MKQTHNPQGDQTSEAVKASRRVSVIRALEAKRDDLCQRAGLMGRCGYMASCFELLDRASAVERQIFAVEFSV